MMLQNGKLYKNRTYKYLYPSIKYYGEELRLKLNTVSKMAIGVGDINISSAPPALYILLDTSNTTLMYQTKFSEFLEWIRTKYFYFTDYLFTENSHMIVIKIPSKFENIIDHFLLGEYSKLYPLKEINQYFCEVVCIDKKIEENRNKEILESKNILMKNINQREIFIKKVQQDFGLLVNREDFLNVEIDYPPKLKEEIFNL